ncbi:MAG: hypothetical protein QOI66_3935 [Myxococcales bacterium]|nr:hypothetical protein [Myxococcales bacterium]
MVRRTWRVPQMRLTCLLQLTALALYGCGGGGNGNPAPGSGGSPGKDGPGASDTNMMGDSASMNDTAAPDGSPDAVADDVAAGSGGNGSGGNVGTGGAGGSGGTKADAAPGTGGKTMDAAPETAPPVCQAGEDCTGDYSCTASRCVRQEQEVCHCVNKSLFCGPVSCAPDAGAADATQPTDAAAAVCPNSTSTGDKCDAATERMCAFPCTNNRHRECFCSQTLNEWVCTGATRC